jgi:hypothetical protein
VNLTVCANAGAQASMKIKTAATLNKQALFAWFKHNMGDLLILI